MACRLYSPVLNLFRDGLAEKPLLFSILGEVWVVPCVTLNADPPALLCHSKHKCPPFFGEQVDVGQNQEALILLKTEVVFEVFKELPCMILFDLGISPDPCTH